MTRIQTRIVDGCRDDLHKLNFGRVRAFGLLALKGLNVKAPCQALPLGKTMAEAALREWVRQIAYQAHWRGHEVVKIEHDDRSTGVCPACGTTGDKLPLKVRV